MPTRPQLVLILAVVCGFVMTPGMAHAKPVNAEVLRPNPFREGWSGGLDGSFALSRGRRAVTGEGSRLTINHRTP